MPGIFVGTGDIVEGKSKSLPYCSRGLGRGDEKQLSKIYSEDLEGAGVNHTRVWSAFPRERTAGAKT